MSFPSIRIKKGEQLLPSWKMMHELDVLQRASEGRQKFLVNLANEKQNFSSTQTEKEYGVELLRSNWHTTIHEVYGPSGSMLDICV
jgi:hypothetical protein